MPGGGLRKGLLRPGQMWGPSTMQRSSLTQRNEKLCPPKQRGQIQKQFEDVFQLAAVRPVPSHSPGARVMTTARAAS